MVTAPCVFHVKGPIICGKRQHAAHIIGLEPASAVGGRAAEIVLYDRRLKRLDRAARRQNLIDDLWSVRLTRIVNGEIHAELRKRFRNGRRILISFARPQIPIAAQESVVDAQFRAVN